MYSNWVHVHVKRLQLNYSYLYLPAQIIVFLTLDLDSVPVIQQKNPYNAEIRIPNRNIAVMCATLSGRVAFRGYMIKKICEVLDSTVNKDPIDINDLFTSVNRAMNMQIPVLQTTLQRKLILRARTLQPAETAAAGDAPSTSWLKRLFIKLRVI